MNNGWQSKQLADLCDVFVDGDWIESKDQSADGIRLIQTGNIGEGIFRDRAERARYVSSATFEKLRCTEIREGDCLISRLPDPVGRSCIVPETGERMITAVDCTIVRFNPRQFMPEFFNYYSRSDDYLRTVSRKCTGATRSRISRSNLGLTPVPVPPLTEQQRIVGILDDAFSGISTAETNTQRSLENTRDLFESHLHAVFTQGGPGWREKTVAELASHSLGKMLDRAKNRGEPRPYLRNLNVRWFEFDLTNVLEMRFLPEEVERYTAVKGDLLICEGGYPGRGAIWESDEPIHFQKALHRVRFHEPDHSKWFLYYLYFQDRSGKLRQQFSGAGIQHFTGEALARFNVPVPPLSEMRPLLGRFDDLAEDSKSLEAIYHQKLVTLDTLKKSLLHQAFTGKL